MSNASGMRDHLILRINGVRREVRGSDAFLTLSSYLRDRLGLVGTKVMCGEGDCGACTVLVADADPEGTPRLRPIDSCIRFLFQLDGCDVTTVEGLAEDRRLTAVQQAMVDCHGSQCGFCTPGMVMAIEAACRQPAADEPLDWRQELAGNLCRCTGYLSIIEAAEQAATGPTMVHAADAAWMAERDRLRRESVAIDGEITGRQMRVSSPATLAEALALRLDPQAQVIAGGTDLGVRWNKGGLRPQHWIDISRLGELAGLGIETTAAGPTLVAGPLATWTDMIEICRVHCPEAVPVLLAFGGPQIRHVGTLGGNIVNGSPIADALPLLFVLEATLCLASAEATREVPIGSFFRGYKELDLAADELLVGIRIPLPAAGQVLRLVKVARRRDLDISGFTAAILMRRRGEQIDDARIAYGGVGPTVLRLGETEAFLAGRPFTEETFQLAGERAAAEIRPQTDVRGTADYRRQLARGVLLRFFYEQRAEKP